MTTLLQDCPPVEMIEFEPSEADLQDYHRWSAEVERRWQLEREDRDAEMEKIRREDFNNARSAACQIRGIASALRCEGQSGVAERLLAASDDVMSLVTRYA